MKHEIKFRVGKGDRHLRCKMQAIPRSVIQREYRSWASPQAIRDLGSKRKLRQWCAEFKAIEGTLNSWVFYTADFSRRLFALVRTINLGFFWLDIQVAVYK